MAPPSALTIATSSLERLIKEEASYHRELQEQEQRLQRLRTETNPDENQNWNIKQEVRLKLKSIPKEIFHELLRQVLE